MSSQKQSKWTVHTVVSMCAGLVVACSSMTAIDFMAPKAAYADSDTYSWSDATTLDQATYDWGYSTCPSTDATCKNYSSLNYVFNGITYGEADPWVYYLRNCTSYVAEKVNQEFNGRGISGWGNAATWATRAQSAGYALDNSPQVGDIAVWGSEVGGGYGHVAYVYAASNGVGSLDEYNVAGTGQFSSNRTTASGSAGVADWYVHMGSPAGGGGGGGGGGGPTYHKADIIVHDPSAETWSSALSTGSSFSGVGVGLYGWSAGDWSALGDVTGDGEADIVVHDPNTGSFDVAKSNGDGSFTGLGAWLTGWGAGDWAGLANVYGHANGEDDLIIHANGTFYVAENTGSSFASPLAGLYGWGIGDWTAVGDVTGDGKADLVVHNPSNETFAVAKSNGDGSFTGLGSWLNQWSAGQWTSLANVSGHANGMDDIVVYNSSGNQFVVATSDGTKFNGSGQWFAGWSIGDWAGTADVTGDGAADIIVHDPTNQKFNVLKSNGQSGGFTALGTWLSNWGAGDSTRLGDIDGK